MGIFANFYRCGQNWAVFWHIFAFLCLRRQESHKFEYDVISSLKHNQKPGLNFFISKACFVLHRIKNRTQKTFYLANFYRLVRVPAWLWNLEFCTKIGIQKSRCHFLRVWRHKKRFAVILTYFFALSDRFSHFWHVFCQFCDQAEIH